MSYTKSAEKRAIGLAIILSSIITIMSILTIAATNSEIIGTFFWFVSVTLAGLLAQTAVGESS